MKSVLVALLAVTTTCYAAPKQRDRKNDGYPSSLDWRTKGVISPVQNRSRDISGTALIAMETVQSLHAIQTGGPPLNLSLPQVVDCVGHDLVVNTFGIISLIGGLCLEKSYPRQGNKCDAGECPVAAPVKSSGTISNSNEMEIAIQKGPVMVFMYGGLESFKSYSGGIYSDPGCNTGRVSNALQVVGYGEENGKEFWICKNNWGTDWGEKGYVRILKGVNMCYVEDSGQYPV